MAETTFDEESSVSSADDNNEPVHDDDDPVFDDDVDVDANDLPREQQQQPPPRYADVLARLAPRALAAPTRMMVLDVIVRRSQIHKTEALLIGRCDDGLSACICVDDWSPYLFVRAPPGPVDASTVADLLEAKLDTYFEQRLVSPERLQQQQQLNSSGGGNNNNNDDHVSGWKNNKKKQRSHIERISVVNAKSIYGFSEAPPGPFLKIEVATPYLIDAVRDVFSGYPVDSDTHACTGKDRVGGVHLERMCTGALVFADGAAETFNSSIEATAQFMADLDLSGCQWLGVPRAAELFEPQRSSMCAHEWRISATALARLPDLTDVAPLRVLSFDLEAAGRRGIFPQASHDSVIQIALSFQVVGSSAADPIKPVLLSFKDCLPIEGADVLSFDDEGDLLRAFRDLAVAFDADVFTGFNILNFDFPYLHDRAAALSNAAPRVFERYSVSETDDSSYSPVVRHFDNLTRVRGVGMKLRETEYVSAQTGKRKRTRVVMPGRVCMDMLIAIQNVHRLESYSLKACAEHFLKDDNKVDLPFTQITPKWEAGPEGRHELGVYCLKDAELPLTLNGKVNALLQTVEMARATGVPFDAVLQRGVLVRNTSLLLRQARVRGFVFPNLSPCSRQPTTRSAPPPPVGRQQRYSGATVLDPTCGIHRWVGVLDFSAMYPSIIAAHNLCFCTIVLDKQHPYAQKRMRNCEIDDDEGVTRILGHTFVTTKHQRGLLPDIVMHLQACREQAKAKLKVATDPLEKSILDACQLAYKVAANGMYGALGSALSLLPLTQIAESVTAMGRHDLLTVKRIALETYPDADVVYGDTDSVFVRLNLPTEVQGDTIAAVTLAGELTLALADRINAVMRAPSKIAFEKILSVMLLLSKKRYAATKYDEGFVFGKDKPKLLIKGLQSVRRDGCSLVRDLVKDVVASILESGSEVDAASIVRARLNSIVIDEIPLAQYAIKKTLRKSFQDCSKPLTRNELHAVRKALKLPLSDHPLTYAEEDAAILAKIPIPYRARIRLPHVILAWRLRRQDPGAAPVPGESVEYIITCNGGGRTGEKVETPTVVAAKHIPVDRKYYIDSLRTPLDNLFGPIAAQRLRAQHPELAEGSRELKQEVAAALDLAYWRVLKGRRLEATPEAKRARIEHSPLAQAFARGAAAARRMMMADD
jgi:DNA polymerase delta subunit 1